MNGEQAYELWAPRGGPWSPWAKPILFAAERDWSAPGAPELDAVPEPVWTSALDESTALVVDLPGADSVRWGVALARRGWRPVPLYNALPGHADPAPSEVPVPTALVDVAAIVRALRPATAELGRLALAAKCPPAFLLHAERRHGAGAVPEPGRFDNRSISLPTDFPSATFLHAHGIRQVILVGATSEPPQADLAHTLMAWQQAGLPILAVSASGAAQPVPIRVQKPSRFRLLWYRMLATLHLRRSPLGGFGGMIPIASAG